MKTIQLNSSRMTCRADIQDYMEELFDLPEYYGRNLDGLYDCLCEIEEDIEISLSRQAVTEICSVPYAYKTLMVFGKAADENPHLHILFRQ